LDVSEAANTIIFKGNFAAEKDGDSPEFASAVKGTGDAELTFDSVLPGAGCNVLPIGNRIIMVLSDPGDINQALDVDSAVLTINSKKYFAVLVSLETDGSGDLASTGAEVAAALNGDATIATYLKTTAGGTGLDIVQAAVPFQLEDGVGGIYDVLQGDPSTGAWEICPVTTWTDAAVTVAIDGTGGYAADDMYCFLVVANGLAFPAWVHAVS
jgi:hypothetical protein